MSLLDKANDGYTALIYASRYGQQSTVKALLAAGANIEGKWVGSLLLLLLKTAESVVLFIYIHVAYIYSIHWCTVFVITAICNDYVTQMGLT
jgi:ankyrin repeat protein